MEENNTQVNTNYPTLDDVNEQNLKNKEPKSDNNEDKTNSIPNQIITETVDPTNENTSKVKKDNNIESFYNENTITLDGPLKVNVTDFNKTCDKDLLSTSYYVYGIECSNFNSKVYRRYNDFLWFRETLRKYYPGLHIPPIPSKSVTGKLIDDEFHMKRVRGFNKFFDHLSKQKVLSNSIITKDFLTETVANEFLRKKTTYSNYKADSESLIGKINGKYYSIINI